MIENLTKASQTMQFVIDDLESANLHFETADATLLEDLAVAGLLQSARNLLEGIDVLRQCQQQQEVDSSP